MHNYVGMIRIAGFTLVFHVQEGVLCVSLGYFVYDLVCGWYIEYKTHSRNVANTIHHLVCTLGLSVAVLTGNVRLKFTFEIPIDQP